MTTEERVPAVDMRDIRVSFGGVHAVERHPRWVVEA